MKSYAFDSLHSALVYLGSLPIRATQVAYHQDAKGAVGHGVTWHAIRRTYGGVEESRWESEKNNELRLRLCLSLQILSLTLSGIGSTGNLFTFIFILDI